MNCNEISNYSTQEQPFYGAAWLVLNILLELVLLLSSVSLYVVYDNLILKDGSYTTYACVSKGFRICRSFVRC